MIMMLHHAILAIYLAPALLVSAFQHPQSIVSQHHRLDAGVVKPVLRSSTAAAGLQKVLRSTPNDGECAKDFRRLSFGISSSSSRAVLTAFVAAFTGLVVLPLDASAAASASSIVLDPVVSVLGLFVGGFTGISYLDGRTAANIKDLKTDLTSNINKLERKIDANSKKIDANSKELKKDFTANMNKLESKIDANSKELKNDFTANIHKLESKIDALKNDFTANMNKLESNLASKVDLQIANLNANQEHRFDNKLYQLHIDLLKTNQDEIGDHGLGKVLQRLDPIGQEVQKPGLE